MKVRADGTPTALRYRSTEWHLWNYYLSCREPDWLGESGPSLVRLCKVWGRIERLEKALEGRDPVEDPDYRALAKMLDSATRVALALERSLRISKQSRYRADSSQGRIDPLPIDPETGIPCHDGILR